MRRQSEILELFSIAVVSNPGSGELQGLLFFVVTLHFTNQLEQLITQLKG